MDTICPQSCWSAICQEQCGTTMDHVCGTTMGYVCGTTTGHGCGNGELWWTKRGTVVKPTQQGVCWDTVLLVVMDNLHPWTGPGQPGMAVVQPEFPACL